MRSDLQSTPPRTPPSPGAPVVRVTRSSRRDAGALAPVLVLLGLAVAAAALLGPLGLGVIEYHVSSGATAQVRGGDLVGLVLVAPTCLVAAWLVRRGHPGAPALAVAPAAYALYTAAELAVAGDVRRYPGTSERWFPLLLVVLVLGGAALVLAGSRLAATAPGPVPLRRTTGWYLVAVAAFLALGLHLPGLLDAWRATPRSAEYLADPSPFWTVKVLDLGVVVPVLLVVGVGLLRDRPWARVARAPVVAWCALLGSAVAGMAVVMLGTGAAGASVGLTVGFVGAAALALALAAAVFRPLLGQRTEEAVG